MVDFSSIASRTAQAALHKYESQNNNNYGKTGGQELNSPNNSNQDQNSGNHNSSSSPFAGLDLHQIAAQHFPGQEGVVSAVLDHLTNMPPSDHHDPVNEEQAAQAHNQAYNEQNTAGMSPGSIGQAAAMQAFKKFTGNAGGNTGGGNAGGNNVQAQIISFAMAQAAQLFDKSGGGGRGAGGKQDAINGAAATAMKLLVQSKFSPTTGGANSGGLGSLLSMASKFAQ